MASLESTKRVSDSRVSKRVSIRNHFLMSLGSSRGVTAISIALPADRGAWSSHPFRRYKSKGLSTLFESIKLRSCGTRTLWRPSLATSERCL